MPRHKRIEDGTDIINAFEERIHSLWSDLSDFRASCRQHQPDVKIDLTHSTISVLNLVGELSEYAKELGSLQRTNALRRDLDLAKTKVMAEVQA